MLITHLKSESESRSVVSYSVHGILLSRILEWEAAPFSRGSSQPRDQTRVSHIAGRFFTNRATREAPIYNCSNQSLQLYINFQKLNPCYLETTQKDSRGDS